MKSFVLCEKYEVLVPIEDLRPELKSLCNVELVSGDIFFMHSEKLSLPFNNQSDPSGSMVFC
jgi:hypothetical protein